MPLEERWPYRTKITFSDGLKPLADVLTLPKVKASVIVPYVCYDHWVDEDNPSGIRVCKPINSKEANPSWLGIAVVDTMISRFIDEQCCKLDVNGP